MSDRLEAVVIGTGFGGGITACRLSQRWPGQVLVLERGKRYAMGAFPRSPHAFSRNFWNLKDEKRSRPSAMCAEEQHGLFDIRNLARMDAVLAAGVGGGSLIYANVFLEPPDHVLADPRWPSSCRKPDLQPYYAIAKQVLGSRPIPVDDDPRRRIVRTELFQAVGRELGRESRLVDINVFFGNDFENPSPIGRQERNRYGALQTSCVYCAECDVGCNTHSKNTIDLNYLYVAEHDHQADVRTEHLAERVSPVNEGGDDDPSQDGRHGWSVTFADLAGYGRRRQRVLARRVVVSCGTLGSTELLMRARDVFGTLARVSPRLGTSFSGNGDFLSFVLAGDRPADPNYGPVITQRIDFNLFQDCAREHAFILEDASYPVFAAWFSEGVQPRFKWIAPMLRATYDTLAQFFKQGRSAGHLGFALRDLIGGDDLSFKTTVLLCMGLDSSNGRMFLGADKHIDVDWPQSDSRPLYDAILAAGERFRERTGGTFLPLPNWSWPFRRNVTVHSLGGCCLGESPEAGVTSADPARFGQVFGYEGLYVADGAIVPTAVGANPTATISALSERVAEGITGRKPDADLKKRT
jgi:cholesterol oxidase